MKRKLLGIVFMIALSFGKCAPQDECFDLRPDYCGLDGRAGVVVKVNNQPRIIYSK